MEFLMQFFILAVGFGLLVKGADWFVAGASGIASKFGIPQLVIGLTIVAMGTSAPEAAVSISAALAGSADITIGNILGSNILNILIILGICACILPVAVAKSTIRVDIPFLSGITLLLLLFGYTGNQIVLWEAVVFLVVFVGYLVSLYLMAKKNPQPQEDFSQSAKPTVLLVLTALGLVCIIAGSHYVVQSASVLATLMGMSERFIGLTIVAFGTSLPELVTSVTAARKGNADIAIGNIVGSNIFNILFIVGLTGCILPVPFATHFVVDTLVSLVCALLLLASCIKSQQLTRKAGVLLLACYAGYFAYLVL